MKLKTALALFSERERLLLDRVLESQILGNQASITTCYRACVILMRTDPDWGEHDLCNALFPDQAPATYIKYLRTRTSTLMRYVEQYMAFQNFQSDKAMQAACLVSALNTRGWQEEYHHAYNKAIQTIDQQPLKGFGHYAIRDLLFEDMIATENPSLPRPDQPQFQQALDALDRAYFCRKLSLAVKAISQDRIRQTKKNIPRRPELQAWAARQNFASEPILLLYELLLRISQQPNPSTDQDYQQARNLFLACQAYFDETKRAEAQDIVKQLVNYCVLRYNQKAEFFREELVLFYKEALQSGVLLSANQIEPIDFSNAFRAFLWANDDQSIQWLIDNLGANIKGDSAFATRQYCMGTKAMQAHRFENAIVHFSKSLAALPKHRFPQLEINLFAELARSNYITSNYWDAAAHTNTILRLLQVKQIGDVEKQAAFRQFAEILRMLCMAQKHKLSRKEQLAENLRNRIQVAAYPIFASRWICNQIELLIKQ